VACWAYPCSQKTWKSLEEGNRLIHKATITVGIKALHLWLTAVPMALDSESVSQAFVESVRQVITR
jgi:hypothetical protein